MEPLMMALELRIDASELSAGKPAAGEGLADLSKNEFYCRNLKIKAPRASCVFFLAF